jgi:hypothetical protein
VNQTVVPMVYVKEVTMPLSVYVMVDLQEMIVQSLYVQEHPNVVGMVRYEHYLQYPCR